MHELAIADSIHRIVTEEARRGGATRITSLTVQVGALSGIVVDSLEFVFPAVSRGGLAEGATLIIERIAGRGRCPACAAELEIGDFLTACPECGHVPLEIIAGRELRVKEIEVE
jgi:hydrogenase nickel incorporation protein HypA/HybF